MPTIGDLFRAKPEDIQETINSVYYMMKQRVSDIDFKQDIRSKMNKHENAVKEYQDALGRAKQKNDQLASTIKDLENKLRNQD